MTRRRLLQEMDSREWTGWYAYFRVKAEKEREANKRAQLDAGVQSNIVRRRRR